MEVVVNQTLQVYWLYPPPPNKVEGAILKSPWLYVCLYVRLSVNTILSWTFLLQFCMYCSDIIHNVCVHMKLCMCNFHYNTIIGCGIISPWTCKFYWINVVQRNNPAVLHVLNSKLHTILLAVYSSACAIFITILSLVAELSPLVLVNFTKSLLSRALLLHFCKYCSEIYTQCLCVYEVVHMQFSCPSVCLSVDTVLCGATLTKPFSILWPKPALWQCVCGGYDHVHL